MDSRELVMLLESPMEDVGSVEVLRSAIDAGLRSPTPYWPELAVGWLERGAPMHVGTLKLLEAVASTGTFPQDVRQRAFALVLRFGKSQGGS